MTTKARAHKSPTHRLIETKMREPLRSLVKRKRKDEISWRRIAKHIYEETGVRVTPVALRGWFLDIE